MNLNDNVLVRLLPRGDVAYEEYWKWLGLPDEHRHRREPDGRLKLPLWEVMKLFGPHIELGRDSPIETELEIV